MSNKRPVSSMQIRLPVELKEWLRAQAAANYRTINGEIVRGLESIRLAAEAGARRGETQ